MASEKTAAYRALIVDYGGVLTTSMSSSFGAFCLATGVNPDRLRAVLAAAYTGDLPMGAAGEGQVHEEGLRDLVVSVETGRLAVEEFDRLLAEALSHGLDRPIEATDLTGRLFGAVRPDERMLAVVRAARLRGFRTGLVSNTWGHATFPGLALEALFDTMVLSGEVGLRKPQPHIYLLAASRLGVAPDACVFVDDIPVNVEGARATGMAGVLHRDAVITIPKLEALFGVSLSPPD
jgi:putative hydrolase of the HAD superfamily